MADGNVTDYGPTNACSRSPKLPAPADAGVSRYSENNKNDDMTISYSSGILNSLISPEFTSFVKADIPDISSQVPQAHHWLGNFFLNSAFRGRFDTKLQQLVLGYLRRAHHAFNSFHDARSATFKYLEKGNPHEGHIRLYYDAIYMWENYVLQIYMAMDLYNAFSKPDKAFEKNDGSKEQRIYTIANQVKHVGHCVHSGQCKEEDTLPLLLINDGLSSFDTKVSFIEASDILIDIAKLADLLQDPSGFIEKVKDGSI